MRNSLLSVVCFITLTFSCLAQEPLEKPAAEATVFTGQHKPSRIDILYEMKANYPALYAQYRSGKKMTTAGWIILGAGTSLFIFDYHWLRNSTFGSGEIVIGMFLLIPSVGGIVTSIPFLITGSIRKGRVIRDFQRQHYLSQPSRQIQFNVYPNRVGIAYVF